MFSSRNEPGGVLPAGEGRLYEISDYQSAYLAGVKVDTGMAAAPEQSRR